jgi:signal transduction histidine kinase
LSQKAVVPHLDQRLAEILHARRGAVLREVSGQRFDDTLNAIVDSLVQGRPELLLALCPEPVESVRLVRHVAAAAIPALWDLSDAPELVAKLLELSTEAGLAAAEAHRMREDRRSCEMSELMDVKTAFLRITTHELRRPVSTARGYLELIDESTFGPVPESLQRPLKLIAASNLEIARLVNGLSTIARLEDHADVLDLRSVSLAGLVEDAVTAIRPAAELAGVEMRCDLDRALVGEVDRERMTTVVANLLANAVKYSPAGGDVEVALRRVGRRAQISVTDHGSGVEPGDETRVFEPYFRSERSRASGVNGLGLGLYIVRQITELHGGRVGLDNRHGEGASFRITLPLPSRGRPVSATGGASPASRG